METYDYRPYEELTTPVDKARWTRQHRKVADRIKRNTSSGDSTAGMSAISGLRGYKPRSRAEILAASELKVGMVVRPLNGGGQFTINSVKVLGTKKITVASNSVQMSGGKRVKNDNAVVFRGQGRPVLINGKGVPPHVSYRVISK